jgi:hypothetical protein
MVTQQSRVSRSQASRLALIATGAVVLSLVLAVSALGRTQSERHGSGSVLMSRHITTLVLNGTNRHGLANQVSRELASLGVTTRYLGAPVANAPRPTEITTIYFDPQRRDASTAAQRLRHLFRGDARVRLMPQVIRRYADRAGQPMTVVVIGSSYHGLS